jgi:hypothetical protein
MARGQLRAAIRQLLQLVSARQGTGLTADAEGRFRIDGLPAGLCPVHVAARFLPFYSQPCHRLRASRPSPLLLSGDA